MTDQTPATPVELVVHGLRYRADPSYEAFVRDVVAREAATPERLPGAELVKQNRVRTVVRLPGPDGAIIYVKRFRVLRLGDRLLSLVRASPARREWRALLRLSRAGVPCPVPLFLGEERRLGLLRGSVLATRAVERAADLGVRLDAARAAADAPAREALLAALAPLVRALFHAGADHPDLHLGNFLVRDERDLFALDLHSCRLRSGPLPAAARRGRLGKLAHSLGLFQPPTRAAAEEELAWFARAYASVDPELGPADALALDLHARAARVEATRLASRGRRCLVDSTTFAVDRALLGPRTYRRREASAELVRSLVDAPPLELLHAHPRGRSRLELVAAPEEVAPGGRLVRKRYPFPTLGARLAGLRDPLPLRAWKAARACEVRGVPTPRHLAVVIEGALWPTRATLFMEHLAGVTMVHKLFEGTPPAPAARRALARDVGRVVGRLHATGLVHHDLAVQNLLVRPRPEQGSGWDVWVVDLDEVRVARLSLEAKLRALTQLADLPAAATRTDRARFFRAYLDAGGAEVLADELAAWGARGLGQRVAERLAARAAAKARRAAARELH